MGLLQLLIWKYCQYPSLVRRGVIDSLKEGQMGPLFMQESSLQKLTKGAHFGALQLAPGLLSASCSALHALCSMQLQPAGQPQPSHTTVPEGHWGKERRRCIHWSVPCQQTCTLMYWQSLSNKIDPHM